MRFKHQQFKGQQDKIFCPTDAFFYEISPEVSWILTCVFVKAFEGTCAHMLWACAGEEINALHWQGSLVGKHRGIRRGSCEHPSHWKCSSLQWQGALPNMWEGGNLKFRSLLASASSHLSSRPCATEEWLGAAVLWTSMLGFPLPHFPLLMAQEHPVVLSYCLHIPHQFILTTTLVAEMT